MINQKRNFYTFIWHAIFYAFATSFMDIDTVIPSMIIKAGGNELLLGLLTAIMIGIPRFFQFFFASFLSNKKRKKNFLIGGIYMRVLALFALSVLLYNASYLVDYVIIILIFVIITVFSLSGSFAGVPYVDIMGKSMKKESRRKFFSVKQIINGLGVLISAFIVREILKQVAYPYNYSLLFVIASGLLLIASIGFLRIDEKITELAPKKTFLQFVRLIPSELKNNSNLKFYLLIINMLGVGFSTMPFFIALAKSKFGLPYQMIGNFLIFRVVGMLFTGILIYLFDKKINYKLLLKIAVVIGSLLPIVSLFLSDYSGIYMYLFIFSGIFFSIYKVSIDGIFLEITNDTNRAEYVGISGVGNILTIVFPLIAGFLLSIFDYTGVFIGVSVFVLSSLFFVNKLRCK